MWSEALVAADLTIDRLTIVGKVLLGILGLVLLFVLMLVIAKLSRVIAVGGGVLLIVALVAWLATADAWAVTAAEWGAGCLAVALVGEIARDM